MFLQRKIDGVPVSTLKKAELLSEGEIFVHRNIRLPYVPSRSTAGPTAGRPTIVLGFDGRRAELGINRSGGRFELVQSNTGWQIFENKKLFLTDVKIVPTLLHAPEQAFVNLSPECIYSCGFCSSRFFVGKHPDLDSIVELILRASRAKGFNAVAVTSGVRFSPSHHIEELAYVIKKVRQKLGDEIPIGVEPYVNDRTQIEVLYSAGANEIKLNLHSYDRILFSKICPDWDFENVLAMIQTAGEVFGRNRVCSNLLLGLGESDENILAGIEALAVRSCVATLRAVRLNELNASVLSNTLGYRPQKVQPERLIKLALLHKKILLKHKLTTLRFKTMCHRCGGCDIVPFVDI